MSEHEHEWELSGAERVVRCTRCDLLYQDDQAHRSPPNTPELEPDPFHRIELAAAAWRNAYRAYERRDRPAVERHLREAIDHSIALVRGLHG